jgi:hypothetical protein
MGMSQKVEAICQEIYPELHGQGSEVIGAVLGELVSKWLAGHVVIGSRDDTEKRREEILAMWLEMVRALVPLQESEIERELQRFN